MKKWKPAPARWVAAFATASKGLGEPRPFEPTPGRGMREYVVAPETLADQPVALRGWVGKAFRYASSLPAKPARSTPRTRSARERRA